MTPLEIKTVAHSPDTGGWEYIEIMLVGHDFDGEPVEHTLTLHHRGDLSKVAEVLKENLMEEDQSSDWEDFYGEEHSNIGCCVDGCPHCC